MSEDNTYTKIAQMVLGTFVEQVADLVRARVNTSVSVNEEMIQGMVCEAFKHEFDAAMKDKFNRHINSTIDGFDVEDMIDRAIDQEVQGKYIKNMIADSIQEKLDDEMPEARIQEIIGDKVQLLMETGNVIHPVGTESLKQEIGLMSSQLGNLEAQIAGLRRDLDKIVQACASINLGNLP